MKKYQIFIILLLSSSFLIFPTGNLIQISNATQEQSNIISEVEIEEYEGKDLSSINSFRENSIRGPQFIDPENYSLVINGLVNNKKSLSYNEIVNNFTSYKKVVTLNCVEGWRVTILWEGILIKDLLADLKVDPNETTVIFYAYDGYSTSLPLDYIIDNDILIAYKMNNVTLPPERGFPFQLVAESKWGYKWIKWITEISLSSNQEYLGYWEQRGYSNEADLSGGFFDATIPEFPSVLILPMLIVVSIVIIIIRKKRLNQKK
jgi:DMSO/TMAO reductase YedYZ molybdopterin-dependent catalytic subunit